jgi:hypothetical protein
MKKLFSLAIIFIMALALAGCSTTKIDELELEIDELNQEILDTQSEMGDYVIENTLLENELSDTHQTLVELEAEFLVLLDELALLQNQIFDNVITFTLENEYGNFSSETIGYNDDYDGTLFDLLNENLEVGYSESEYGKYIYSLGDLNPKNGAYISFSKNGVSSMVGVELSTFEDGDIFGFEVIWWDTFQQEIDDLIQLFLESHASDYVNSESVEYNVLLGLNLLGVVSDYVTMEQVETLVEESTLSFVQDYFKAVMMMNSVGSNSDLLLEELNLIVTPGVYGQTAYGLLAMDSVINTEDYSSFVTAAIADLETTTPYDLGLDAGGISIVALSNYTGVDTLINDYTSWISSSQLDSGGVLTRDVIWGETTYPGTENASSISQVILGLIANGIDPTGLDYTKGTNNLISRLLDFGTDTGSFDYVLGDEVTEDLAFSTPQAFLVLVTYQVYANTYSAVNPYDFT